MKDMSAKFRLKHISLNGMAEAKTEAGIGRIRDPRRPVPSAELARSAVDTVGYGQNIGRSGLNPAMRHGIVFLSTIGGDAVPMRIRNLQFTLVAALLIAVGSAQAAPIPGLFNTGVDAFGTPRANQAPELHYVLVPPSVDLAALRVATSANGFPIGPWFGDDAFSAWIGPATDAALDDATGNYDYRLTFSLSGFIPSSASISGLWAQDNTGVDILINGVSTGQTAGGFSAFTPFAISSGFVAGTNTIDFIINNGGGPTGLRVEMTGTATAVTSGGAPEPASLVLIGAGLAAFALYRRR
jgi:hypothetical protein